MRKREKVPHKKVATDKSAIVTAIPFACANERAAVEFMELQRWEGEAPCPRCGDMNVYQMQDRQTGERQKNYRWRCRGCQQQFTVRVGTVMEDSPIPLRHWCLAFYLACTAKKGVSAMQIKRQTGLSYKSALFLMHRIHYAMQPEHDTPLSGTVEVDQTYVWWETASRVPSGIPRTVWRGDRRDAPSKGTDADEQATRRGDGRAWWARAYARSARGNVREPERLYP